MLPFFGRRPISAGRGSSPTDSPKLSSRGCRRWGVYMYINPYETFMLNVDYSRFVTTVDRVSPKNRTRYRSIGVDLALWLRRARVTLLRYYIYNVRPSNLPSSSSGGLAFRFFLSLRRLLFLEYRTGPSETFRAYLKRNIITYIIIARKILRVIHACYTVKSYREVFYASGQPRVEDTRTRWRTNIIWKRAIITVLLLLRFSYPCMRAQASVPLLFQPPTIPATPHRVHVEFTGILPTITAYTYASMCMNEFFEKLQLRNRRSQVEKMFILITRWKRPSL